MADLLATSSSSPCRNQARTCGPEQSEWILSCWSSFRRESSGGALSARGRCRFKEADANIYFCNGIDCYDVTMNDNYNCCVAVRRRLTTAAVISSGNNCYCCSDSTTIPAAASTSTSAAVGSRRHRLLVLPCFLLPLVLIAATLR